MFVCLQTMVILMVCFAVTEMRNISVTVKWCIGEVTPTTADPALTTTTTTITPVLSTPYARGQSLVSQ